VFPPTSHRYFFICSAPLTSIAPGLLCLIQNCFSRHSSLINFGLYSVPRDLPQVACSTRTENERSAPWSRACLHMVWTFEDIRLLVYLERLHSHGYSIPRDPFIYQRRVRRVLCSSAVAFLFSYVRSALWHILFPTRLYSEWLDGFVISTALVGLPDIT
jgi:hypothetical protein